MPKYTHSEKEALLQNVSEKYSALKMLSPYRILKTLWKIGVNTLFYLFAFLCGGFEVILFYVKQRFFDYRLPNYHEVGQCLFRGGQPSSSGLRDLARNGVKTIVNLRIEDFNHEVVDKYYQDEIRVIHLPFYPYDPSDRLMIEFLKIFCDPKKTPVFVHCFHGADRTGVVVAIYRIIIENWDKESAIAEMKKRGLHWWHHNMIEYINGLDVGRIRKELGLRSAPT